jgi:hypothetical protein
MIKFYIPKGVLRRASVRFRASVPLQGMRKEDGFITKVNEAKSGELIVLAKNVHYEDINLLKQKNIKYIFDICDDKWNKDADLYNYACQNANLITTTCELLRSKIKQYTDKDSFIIPDPTEREREEPYFNPGKHLKLCWFGGRKSFSLFDWDKVFSEIKSVTDNFTVHAVTAKPDRASKRLGHLIEQKKLIMYSWDFKTQGDIVRQSDIVILPLPQDMPLVQVKSPNRLIDGLQQGRFVIANEGVDSYTKLKDYIYLGNIKDGLKWALNNKEQVLEKIKLGQKYIQENHSPEIIGSKWIETEKLV